MTERDDRSLIEKIGSRIRGKEGNRNISTELSPQVKKKLRQLVLRPNPTLAEFPFLGVGTKKYVDTLIYPGERFSDNSGLLKSGYTDSRVDPRELYKIFDKLLESKRTDELMFFGHLHPSGEVIIRGRRYIVKPSEYLLYPSGIIKHDANYGDIKFFKSFRELNPDRMPYVAIAANTEDGPKLRIYNLDKLIKVKKRSEVDKVPQKTISL